MTVRLSEIQDWCVRFKRNVKFFSFLGQCMDQCDQETREIGSLLVYKILRDLNASTSFPYRAKEAGFIEKKSGKRNPWVMTPYGREVIERCKSLLQETEDSLLVPGRADNEKRASSPQILSLFEALKKHNPPFFGESQTLREALHILPYAIQSDKPILLSGETGTGKGLLAKIIHNLSKPSEKFVRINCAAVPETLASSLLFGHKKGAFTGAETTTSGYLAQAEAGTLFVDEIHHGSVVIQQVLLDVLEEKKYRVLGDTAHEHEFTARMIVAHNPRGNKDQHAHSLLDEFFYRFGFRFNLPPLRARKEDIPVLASRILSHNTLYNELTDTFTISDKAMKKLMEYDYPGNVRELMAILDLAHIYTLEEKRTRIEAEDIVFLDSFL